VTLESHLCIRKGLEQAKKFSWEKTAGQTLEVYNKVAGGE